jgi:ribonuclease J
VPVHGEYAHLAAHAKLARELGMPDERVLVCVNGDTLVVAEGGIERGAPISAAEIYVDGTAGGIDADVLRDRRLLGQGGFVLVLVTVDLDELRIVDGPSVQSRGWTTVDASDELHAAVERAVHDGLVLALGDPDATTESIERVVRRAAGSTVHQRTRRRPVIVPVVHFV